MMIAPLVVMLGVCSQTQGAVDANAFAKMINDDSRRIKSCAFLFEGTRRWLGAAGANQDAEKFGLQFQGAYLYRDDGTGLLDVFSRDLTESASVVRSKKAVVGTKAERARAILDAKHRLDLKQDVQTLNATISFLSGSETPHEFFWSWYWKFVWSPSAGNYEFEAWEAVDGHSCLKFRLNLPVPEGQPPTDFTRYWVDMQRGGHVLKAETYSQNKLVKRIDQIRLLPFTAEDKTSVWFPVGCRIQGFVWDDRNYAEPVFQTDLALVEGTIQINLNLPEDLFTVKRSSGLAVPGELSLFGKAKDPHGLRARFTTQDVPRPKLRIDPAGVRQEIEKKLKQAEQQEQEIQASSVARDEPRITFWYKAVLFTLVASGLSLTGWLYLRNRRR